MTQWQVQEATDARMAAVHRLPGATLFHSPRWARVLARGFGGPVRVLALVEADGSLRAACPVSLIRVGPIRILYGTFPKGNFVGDAAALAEHLPELPAVLRAEGVHLLRLIACEEDLVREIPGAVRTRHVRHVLDIGGRSAERIWADYPKKIRRDVRVPRKAGYRVRLMRREEFPAFHEMMRQVFARKAVATGLAPAFYEAIWDELAGDGTAEFLVADKDGRPDAAVVALHDGPTTYYLAGCSRTAAMRHGVSDLVVHALIERAAERRARCVDMLSSAAEDVGLIRYKAKWGAEARPFDLLECWFSPARRLLWRTAMAVARTRVGAAVVRYLRGQG